MKKLNQNKLVVPLSVILIIIFGLLYIQNMKGGAVQKVTQDAPKSDYSFNTLEVERPDQKYPDLFAEIYKQKEHVQTVLLKKNGYGASSYVVSPDQKYVALKTIAAGGTCVWVEEPVVINLNTYALSRFTKLVREKMTGSSITITNLKWLPNNQIEVTMGRGIIQGDTWECDPKAGQKETFTFTLDQAD